MRLALSLLMLALLRLPALAAASLTQPANAEQSSSRAVESKDMEQVRRFTEGVGRDMLRDELGVDLDSLQFQINPRTLQIESAAEIRRSSASRAAVNRAGRTPAARGGGAGGAGAKPARLAPQHGSFLLSVDQSGDLLRLGRDRADIPFGVTLRGDLPVLSQVQTKFWVPFSWREEARAEARLPLKGLGLGLRESVFKDTGLRSDFSTRLGVNQMQAGLGTQWASHTLGSMDLNYDYSQRFGQGLEETVHWLKLRKDF